MNKKPIKKTREAYDYTECRDWLNKKYGRNERDLNEKYGLIYQDSVEYRDFWHFVYDIASPSNGSELKMSESWAEEANEWQREILMQYLDNFGEPYSDDPADGRYITFWVDW